MNPVGADMDVDLARRLLARVPHARRFPVGTLVPPVGLLKSYVRSLEELEFALRPEPRSLPGVHMGALADWVEGTLGDGIGAGRIRDAAGAAPSYVEACQAVLAVVKDRLDGARRALGVPAPRAGQGG